MKRARCLLFVLILVHSGFYLSGRTVHTVSPGDTLYSLARRFGVTVDSLARLNGVSAANLRIGMRLRIPGRGASPPAVSVQNTGNAPPGTVYTVQSGDTAYGICRRHGLDVRGFLTANGLASPDLRIGQRVRLTDRAESAAAVSRTAPKAAGAAAAVRPAARAVGRPQGPSVQTAATHTVPALAWPIRGTIVEKFGVGTRYINNGITIRSKPADPVRAAAAGTVVYSGRQRGYGNLVIVRHGQTVYTVYAHLHERLIALDARVQPGQVIGKAGEVPSAGVDGLHFQVYDRTKAIDPLLCLK
jgi:murein DD-endopeptidase MepM/ murein hydrolase activator NlpD